MILIITNNNLIRQKRVETPKSERDGTKKGTTCQGHHVRFSPSPAARLGAEELEDELL